MQLPHLQTNDEIRIVSPSGHVDTKYIDGAKSVLKKWGFNCTEGKSARNEYGRFAGSDEERRDDLQQAINDPNVKAILCSRGGYGLARIIDTLDFSNLLQHPKWIIGFSDITVLHNALTCNNISSIHAAMTKHITELPEDSLPLQYLKNCLTGNFPKYKIPSHQYNREGKAEGKLIGGNLSLLFALRATPYDLPFDNNILFLEDIAEKPYHIDRMIQNFRLSGVFDQISGLVIGQFSDCEEDPSMKQTVLQIIFDAVKNHNFPVCFDFPAGHVDFNLPLILGHQTVLEVQKKNSFLIL